MICYNLGHPNDHEEAFALTITLPSCQPAQHVLRTPARRLISKFSGDSTQKSTAKVGCFSDRNSFMYLSTQGF